MAAFVAEAEEVEGDFCEDCRVSQVVNATISLMSPGVMDYAVDPERSKMLWANSEEMVRERF